MPSTLEANSRFAFSQYEEIQTSARNSDQFDSIETQQKIQDYVDSFIVQIQQPSNRDQLIRGTRIFIQFLYAGGSIYSNSLLYEFGSASHFDFPPWVHNLLGIFFQMSAGVTSLSTVMHIDQIFLTPIDLCPKSRPAARKIGLLIVSSILAAGALSPKIFKVLQYTKFNWGLAALYLIANIGPKLISIGATLLFINDHRRSEENSIYLNRKLGCQTIQQWIDDINRVLEVLADRRQALAFAQDIIDNIPFFFIKEKNQEFYDFLQKIIQSHKPKNSVGVGIGAFCTALGVFATGVTEYHGFSMLSTGWWNIPLAAVAGGISTWLQVKYSVSAATNFVSNVRNLFLFGPGEGIGCSIRRTVAIVAFGSILVTSGLGVIGPALQSATSISSQFDVEVIISAIMSAGSFPVAFHAARYLSSILFKFAGKYSRDPKEQLAVNAIERLENLRNFLEKAPKQAIFDFEPSALFNDTFCTPTSSPPKQVSSGPSSPINVSSSQKSINPINKTSSANQVSDLLLDNSQKDSESNLPDSSSNQVISSFDSANANTSSTEPLTKFSDAEQSSDTHSKTYPLSKQTDSVPNTPATPDLHSLIFPFSPPSNPSPLAADLSNSHTSSPQTPHTPLLQARRIIHHRLPMIIQTNSPFTNYGSISSIANNISTTSTSSGWSSIITGDPED